MWEGVAFPCNCKASSLLLTSLFNFRKEIIHSHARGEWYSIVSFLYIAVCIVKFMFLHPPVLFRFFRHYNGNWSVSPKEFQLALWYSLREKMDCNVIHFQNYCSIVFSIAVSLWCVYFLIEKLEFGIRIINND